MSFLKLLDIGCVIIARDFAAISSASRAQSFRALASVMVVREGAVTQHDVS